jgi:integrase
MLASIPSYEQARPMNRPRVRDKHLPRNVYLRHNAYYYVKGGKWTRLGKTLKEALNRYAGLYEAKDGTMPALVAKALPNILAKVKPSTVKQYEVAARKLAKHFAEYDPQQVTQADVNDMLKQYVDRPNMGNRVLSLLRSVFQYALDLHYVTANPCVGVKRNREKKRDRLFTMDELGAIYEVAGPRLRVIINLLVLTGQRVGDVLAIRRADLIDDGIQFRQQKTGAKVVIAWNTELREVVERAKGLHANIRALTLLHNRKGKTPDYRTVRQQWDLACERAGVTDAHLHDLRAMSATWAKRQGRDPTAILGHTNVVQTDRYLRDREATLTEGPSFGLSKGLLDKVRGNG